MAVERTMRTRQTRLNAQDAHTFMRSTEVDIMVSDKHEEASEEEHATEDEEHGSEESLSEEEDYGSEESLSEEEAEHDDGRFCAYMVATKRQMGPHPKACKAEVHEFRKGQHYTLPFTAVCIVACVAIAAVLLCSWTKPAAEINFQVLESITSPSSRREAMAFSDICAQPSTERNKSPTLGIVCVENSASCELAAAHQSVFAQFDNGGARCIKHIDVHGISRASNQSEGAAVLQDSLLDLYTSSCKAGVVVLGGLKGLDASTMKALRNAIAFNTKFFTNGKTITPEHWVHILLWQASAQFYDNMDRTLQAGNPILAKQDLVPLLKSSVIPSEELQMRTTWDTFMKSIDHVVLLKH